MRLEGRPALRAPSLAGDPRTVSSQRPRARIPVDKGVQAASYDGYPDLGDEVRNAGRGTPLPPDYTAGEGETALF